MKNTKGKIIIILLIILLVLIGIVCIQKEIFVSSRSLFYKYLISGNIENIAEIDYSEFLENIKQTGTYKNSGNIKLSLEDPNIEDANLKQIINQLSIKYNYQISEDNKDKYVEIKANYGNNEIINLEVAKNNLLVGIREEDFIDKYITLDLGSSKETLNKFNIDSKNALNISPGYNLYNLLYISKKDEETICKTYKDVIFETIPKERYKKSKKQEIEVNGNRYKCNVYKLTTTEEQLNKLYINILEELKNDDLTLNLLLEKYRMLNYNDNSINIEKMKTNIQKEIDESSNSKTTNKDISIIVYENNSKTIRTEIIKENEDICIDVTKNKKGLTTLIKSNIQGRKAEILFNKNENSETEKTYKIIYKEGTTKAKIDIHNSYEKNPNTSILKFGEENSYNLTSMTNEEIEQFYSEMNNNLRKFLMKKIQKLGLSLENFINILDNQENNENTETVEDEGTIEEPIDNNIINEGINETNTTINNDIINETNTSINNNTNSNSNNTNSNTSSNWSDFINSQINQE